MFQKIPVELTKPPSPNLKNPSLLHAIGGGWYMNKLSEKIPTLNKIKQSKKSQEKEDERKTANRQSKLEWLEISDILEYTWVGKSKK